MSKTRKDESELKASIEENLQTMKSAIDDFEMTPDSIDFDQESAKLRDNLLKLAVKYHVLIDGKGSKELRNAAKEQDPELASELKVLADASKSSKTRFTALQNLAEDIASESILAIKAIRTYKLTPEELNKQFIKARKLVDAATVARDKSSPEASLESTPRLIRKNARSGPTFFKIPTTISNKNLTNSEESKDSPKENDPTHNSPKKSPRS
jgi:hypothetical protein